VRTAGIVTTVWYVASLVHERYSRFTVSGHKVWPYPPVNYGHTGAEDVPALPRIVPWQWQQPVRMPRLRDQPWVLSELPDDWCAGG
jgi:hypothetical protein